MRVPGTIFLLRRTGASSPYTVRVCSRLLSLVLSHAGKRLGVINPVTVFRKVRVQYISEECSFIFLLRNKH